MAIKALERKKRPIPAKPRKTIKKIFPYRERRCFHKRGMRVLYIAFLCYHKGMLEKAKQLLVKQLDKEKRYLLAFSGGSDSMALFLLLKEMGANFFAVHVDHGWREESALEAEKLASFAKEEGVPFVLLSLEKEIGGNLEAKAREGRYRLFANFYKEVEADALLLGHHSDDLVETIIKRVFEGSALNHLSFKEISCQNGMVCLRPLIQQTKEEIRGYLAAKKCGTSRIALIAIQNFCALVCALIFCRFLRGVLAREFGRIFYL
jgi:tRNA(Ile)-lysidine synthetase-like protein